MRAINQIISLEVIIPISDIIEAKVLNTASDVVSRLTVWRILCVDKIESYKKPDRQPAANWQAGASGSSVIKNGSVLGAETGQLRLWDLSYIKVQSARFLRNFLTIASFS